MMNKCLVMFLFALFPTLALAADSSGALSFAPPPGDYSIIFLGNIFGLVDGVLHGTGSQILGSMFGVFNSAVLALGGIIIIYTLIVSTLNTAQEGQVLGQRWSSIWVPMRSTLGLALLIPKASGYCLMQIFVMWVTVQGVGAADKVWEAALSYLNRGGVIVQSQVNPVEAFSEQASSVFSGASTILAGQTCMAGLQAALTEARQGYLNEKNRGTGPCAGTPTASMKTFCTTAVPNFIDSVNTVTIQSQNANALSFTAPMPNFDNSNPYSVLNGICGTIRWDAIDSQQLAKTNQITQEGGSPTLSNNELQTAKLSRAIAIRQMYQDLAIVAQIIVNNDPQVNTATNVGTGNSSPFSPVAQQQFGVPFLASGQPCSTVDPKCVGWGADRSAQQSAPLFGGTEFQGAVADYNGIMLPTLTLIQQAEKADTATKVRKFIQEARIKGWALAGSYFFDLARLSASGQTKNLVDKESGLGGSQFDPATLTADAFGSTASDQCQGKYSDLCVWLRQDQTPITNLVGLINGSTVLSAPLSAPQFSGPTSTTNRAVSGKASSTVYGFVNNSVLVNLPGQPGLKPPQFALKINFDLTPGALYLENQKFPCGKVGLLGCLGRRLGDVFYNKILRNLFNSFLAMMASVVNFVVLAFLSLPLLGMAEVFKYGVSFIQQPGVNPVVALANMGVNYINFANELWIYLLGLSISTSIIPVFGIFIFPLLAMVFPLLFTWVATMVAIGFITAYYVPILPYMMFTFGVIAWLMTVIEAMVAAPIVALGVTHPEGHEAFGKGEQAIMILLNVFLRPAMMIIGFIAGIALSYVSVWVINAGFANAIAFISGDASAFGASVSGGGNLVGGVFTGAGNFAAEKAGRINTTIGYVGWAGVYGFFFSILIYTMMYLTAVQKSFTLITYLPDKILRWIGGQPESIGQEATQWGEEAKSKIGETGGKTQSAQAQIDQQLGSGAAKGLKGATSSVSPSSVTAEGGLPPESTPKPPEG